MKPWLAELIRHQAWADAESWRALEAFPGALADAAIVDRLHHLHIVQHAFLWTVKADGSKFQLTTPADFAGSAALKDYGRAAASGLVDFVEGAGEEQLARQVHVPWFKDPPLTIPVSSALTQVAMHSQWHRGQNATRLRELGGDPPTVDFIVWLWKGRPAARW